MMGFSPLSTRAARVAQHTPIEALAARTSEPVESRTIRSDADGPREKSIARRAIGALGQHRAVGSPLTFARRAIGALARLNTTLRTGEVRLP